MECLGGLLGRFGRVGRRLGGFLGHLRAILEASQGVLEASGGGLEASRSRPGVQGATADAGFLAPEGIVRKEIWRYE